MFNLDMFVKECKAALNDKKPGNAIHSLMTDTLKDPKAVAANFNNTISRATPMSDLTIFRSDDLMVLRVALDPRWKSIPHDHGIWGFVGIYQGEEANTFYRLHGESLEEIGRTSVKEGNVLAMDPDTIHSIANPLASTTIGIHVYLGDLHKQKRNLWNPFSGKKETFSLDRFFDCERRLNQTSS